MTLVWRQLLRVVESTHTAPTPLSFGTALYVCLQTYSCSNSVCSGCALTITDTSAPTHFTLHEASLSLLITN